MAAVFSFPLRAQGRTLGALDLYRTTPGPLGEADVRIVAILADVAAAYLVNARSPADSSLIMADLNHRSLHDPLTGLPNRTLLTELLTEALNRRRARGGAPRCCSWTWTGSKPSTTSWVTTWGTCCWSRSLPGSPPPCAPATPWRGWVGTSSWPCAMTCRTIPTPLMSRTACSARWCRRSTSRVANVTLGASIGVALSDRRHPVGAQQLLVAADAAMYEAKRAGGGRHHLIQAAPSLSYPAGAHPAETPPLWLPPR